MIQIIKKLRTVIGGAISKINRNIVWLLGLNITIALCQFIIYSLINKNLGKEFLGVWSLVVAATSIGQVSNFGFSNSLVRYLPEMLLKNEREKIGKMLGTINCSNFFLTLPILVLLYFPAIAYASRLLNPQQLLIFRSVIPLSMAGLFINNLFSVYAFLLDAMQKYYLRSVIQIAGWLFFLIGSIVLMPVYGLKGVAIAFLIQNILQFVIIIGVVSGKKLLQKSYPVYFDRKMFKSIFSFGLKSQYISVLVLLFDPLVKFFITKNLGLGATANYELSNKIVMQARNLLVSTNQVIIPKMVIHRNTGTEKSYFSAIAAKNLFYSVGIGMLVLLLAPLAIFLFTNHYDSTLMQCVIIINIGWVCNMITSVHYYSCIGLDKMGHLVIYHLLLSVTVLILYVFMLPYLHIPLLYFVVPSTALFIGSIYNSFALAKRIDKAFLWLRSGIFLYYIFATFLLLIAHYTNPTAKTYLIMPVLFLPFLMWVSRQYRKGKLLNP